MLASNQVFLSTFFIVSLGFILKKFDFISEKDGKIISKFLMHTTFPALMVVSAAQMKFESRLWAISFIYVAVALLILAISYLVFRNESAANKGLLLMAVGGCNTGLFGFPLVEGLFGKEAMGNIIMVDIGNSLVTFGLAYPIGSYFSSNTKFHILALIKKVLRIPPLLGLLLGLFLNFAGIKLPGLALSFLEPLALGNKPIGLLLLGIYLSFDLDKNDVKNMVKVLAIRYGISVLCCISIYYTLSPSLMKHTLMLCCALPLGLTLLPFSDEMKYNSKLAGTLVNMSLVISFVFMWLVMFFIT